MTVTRMLKSIMSYKLDITTVSTLNFCMLQDKKENFKSVSF